MNRPNLFVTILSSFIFCAVITRAQDTTKHQAANTSIFAAMDQKPAFPGGVRAFDKFILHNLKYPEVANLLRLTGEVYVSFVVEADGSVTHVKPASCTGAGCESEAARVISLSPKWLPGKQNGRPVRVAYTMPIEFYFPDDFGKTPMRKLRNSDFGFLFYINNKVFSLNEAQAILGKSFDPSMIASVEPCADPQYTIADKKETYLVVMKNQ